jgi:hypothetical protein
MMLGLKLERPPPLIQKLYPELVEGCSFSCIRERSSGVGFDRLSQREKDTVSLSTKCALKRRNGCHHCDSREEVED